LCFGYTKKESILLSSGSYTLILLNWIEARDDQVRRRN